MSSAQSTSAMLRNLAKARESARLQAQLHHSLVRLHSQTAGLTPRPVLDRLYAGLEIDGEEYVNLMLAQGESEERAILALAAAHAAGAAEGVADPTTGVIDPTLPEYSRPGRVPRKTVKRGPALRGHPLD